MTDKVVLSRSGQGKVTGTKPFAIAIGGLWVCVCVCVLSLGSPSCIYMYCGSVEKACYWLVLPPVRPSVSQQLHAGSNALGEKHAEKHSRDTFTYCF